MIKFLINKLDDTYFLQAIAYHRGTSTLEKDPGVQIFVRKNNDVWAKGSVNESGVCMCRGSLKIVNA